jgi:hypothetical protein
MMMFFKKKIDGATFIKGLRVTIITALLPIMEEYPELEGVINKSGGTSNWDFFMTAAGVGLYMCTTPPSKKASEDMVAGLIAIDEELPGALSNYMDFARSNSNGGEPLIHITGIWVLWNMLGEFPNQEDSKRLAPAIGTFLGNLVDDLSNEFK